jgi:hypothetical protein
MSAVIRKIVTVVEETLLEMGQNVTPPTRRAAAIAVIENPFAGKYVEDLAPLVAIGEELGELLAKRAVAALGIEGAKAHSYGKAAAVGENGELEHAAAILHPKMGAPVRRVLGKGAALIPSSKKRAARALRWIFRSATRTRHSCEVILTAWKFRSTTPRAPTKSWSQSPSPTAAGRCRGSAG